MKKIAILGSTGSIGTQTLDVVRANEDLEVVGLSAGSNVEKLEEQIREFRPKLVAVWKDEAARDLAVRVKDLNVKIVSGMGGLIELARMKESDILVTAIVGMIGIRQTMEGILAGKDPRKQRNTGNSRTSYYAAGKRVRSKHSSCGQ